MAHVLKMVVGIKDYGITLLTSGGAHSKKPSTTVWPGVCLSDVQADEKVAKEWKPNQIRLDPHHRGQ
ncbi:hypothetical protein N7478_010716 [Penicillium angulare]|uniref:uncharacterized protein n=1 Tax=Penicillium angulare TaxID=116970 RepID=UPI002541665E|nr:uncharacterized protein N7478_010716 [Penicillium angulare]KAJ5267908.1 hypothetical protein N7478_010716 [Penicillium angulare]